MAPPGEPIRVLVVEDSPVTRALLSAILEEAQGFELVAAVGNGEAAVEAVARLRPSVITMDLHMPRLDGVEATRRIMHESPTPIVIVTASSNVDGRSTYEALGEGALSVIARPVGPADPRYAARRRALLEELRLMAGIRLVRRVEAVPAPSRLSLSSAFPAKLVPVEAVAIGASTGGPAALFRLLGDLPRNFEPPILVVQHIAEGFAAGLVEWLREAAPGGVVIPRDGDPILPGHVYVSPDGRHMRVASRRSISLGADPPVDGHRPSATALFESVATTYGRRSLGVILTGMGRDGAAGLVRMRAEGAITLAQDATTSAVFGMPRAAIEAGAVEHMLRLDELGRAVGALVAKSRGDQRTREA